jgi:hypothetical protein
MITYGRFSECEDCRSKTQYRRLGRGEVIVLAQRQRVNSKRNRAGDVGCEEERRFWTRLITRRIFELPKYITIRGAADIIAQMKDNADDSDFYDFHAYIDRFHTTPAAAAGEDQSRS